MLKQGFTDWELLIVSDGCEKTIELCTPYLESDDRIRLFKLPKQKEWSGKVRNTGIVGAKGEYIIYLDVDDYFGLNHLHNLNRELIKTGNPGWAYFDDWLADKEGVFSPRVCEIAKKCKCGTSNIVHKKNLGVYWLDESYYHDWYFICDLWTTGDGVKINGGEYMVCHFPNICDI